MLISPNASTPYRNWAYCCSAIRDLAAMLALYSQNKITNMGEFYRIKSAGRKVYEDDCREKCRVIARKMWHYTRLRDQIALELGDPEQHLLQTEDMLNMIGHVIEVTPRHGKAKEYQALTHCSPDGTYINERFDTYQLLSFGYGRASDFNQ